MTDSQQGGPPYIVPPTLHPTYFPPQTDTGGVPSMTDTALWKPRPGNTTQRDPDQPTTVSQDTVLAFIQQLGIDPDDVASVAITPEAIHVEMYHLEVTDQYPEGQRHACCGACGDAVTHHIRLEVLP